jgi:hypothetical protein
MFVASQKKSDNLLKQKEKLLQESMEKTARLRALRLAKESSEEETSEEKATKAPRAKKKAANRKSY